MNAYRKFLPLLLLLLLAPLLSGCGGAPPLPPDTEKEQPRAELLTKLGDVDGKNPEQLEAFTLQLLKDLPTRVKAAKTEAAKKSLVLEQMQLAYAKERLGMLKAHPDPSLLGDAVNLYQGLGRSLYASVAGMRIAQIEGVLWRQQVAEGNEEQAKEYRRKAIRALEQFSYGPVTAQTYIRENGEWVLVSSRETANKWLDPYFKGTWQYRFLDVLVAICGGAGRNSSYILAIFLIAIIAKVITTPFSVAQFRNMRAMQMFQPEMKKLQEKYKDDKQALAKAQMELMKEHKINPASSCLPMLVQVLILWQVYFAIRHYIAHFQPVHFLYLHSLANPDTIFVHSLGKALPGPILILYTVSMYFTQKLISMPSVNPEQQAQQRMMAILMPFMMLVIMQSFPAAFILYWFLQNVLMTGHQYLIMRPHRAADAAAAAAAAQAAAGDKGEPPTSAPTEALERLSQEKKPAKKKKKRRY